MSTVSGTVKGSSGEPLAGVMHWFDMAQVYINTATVTAGTFTHTIADGTYAAYLENLVPTYPAQWVGGGSGAATAAHIVVAGDRTLDIEHDGSIFVIATPPPVPGAELPRAIVHRSRILEALEAGSVRTATGGKFSAPVVIVEPGDPWISHERSMAGSIVRSRWRLLAVAGRADTEGAFVALAELIDATDAALLELDSVQLPSWARALDMTLDGIPYAACTATIQLEIGG